MEGATVHYLISVFGGGTNWTSTTSVLIKNLLTRVLWPVFIARLAGDNFPRLRSLSVIDERKVFVPVVGGGWLPVSAPRRLGVTEMGECDV